MHLPLIKENVYFNGVKPPVEFRLPKETVCPAVLRSTLNDFLSDTENKKACKIKFLEDWIDTDEKVKYDLIELKTDEDMNVIWRKFHRMLNKGPIEFDATISRLVVDIIKMLKCPEAFDCV